MVSEKDTELEFPHIRIVKASAGSGKTDALAKRYVQFLLSESIPSSGLRNMLAITFSNNAANEIRGRIIKILKKLYFRDKDTWEGMKELLSFDEGDIAERANEKILEIIENYSDFQVSTIDSFMAKIFRAEALNLNYPPEVEFSFSERGLMEYALDITIDSLVLSPEGTTFLSELLRILEGQRRSYLWNPKRDILNKLEDLYTFYTRTHSNMKPFEDKEKIFRYEREMEELAVEILKLKEDYGLNFRSSSNVENRISRALASRNFLEFADLCERDLPINKPPKREAFKQEGYQKAEELWSRLKSIISQYVSLYSRSFYSPYVDLFERLKDNLEEVKRRERKVFIEDINRKISENISAEIVPDVYFKLGETIYHFFIDEFQDTSPIQWCNLKTLIGNSLSSGGSLFVVGDTKQAIYSFRGADYTIMRKLEEQNPFCSVGKNVKIEKLNINWRSKKNIVDFVEDLFLKNQILTSTYEDALQLTGLNEIAQLPREEGGYVEVKKIEYGNDEELKDYILSQIVDLTQRGYSFRDIALLARKNDQITKIASLLNRASLPNGEKIPFISYSSLDIRYRKIVHEILALLSFLDSPTDDFSFSCFILSDLYRFVLEERGDSFDPQDLFLERKKEIEKKPLYETFRSRFSHLWKADFEDIFKLAGYLPVYDLLSVIYEKFNLFRLFSKEEAHLLKLLEITAAFEAKGYGNVKDFIEFFSSSDPESPIFDISLPRSSDALTLMTVHKSKGLGFPVVFLYLEALNYRNLLPSEVIEDDGSSFSIIKLTRSLCKWDEKLERIRRSKEESLIAEFLNLLYVAITRASDELYLICSVKKESDFPFDFLRLQFDKKIGKKSKKESSPTFVQKTIPLTHEPSSFDFKVQRLTPLASEETRKGDFIHRILSSIEYADGYTFYEIKSKLERLAEEVGFNGDLSALSEEIFSLFTLPHTSFLFERKPEREVKNEFQIADKEGNLYRIDRILIDSDEVTVVEYKTGEPKEEHKEQVLKYKKLIESTFGQKKIRGLILYIEEGKVVWV